MDRIFWVCEDGDSLKVRITFGNGTPEDIYNGKIRAWNLGKGQGLPDSEVEIFAKEHISEIFAAFYGDPYLAWIELQEDFNNFARNYWDVHPELWEVNTFD